MKLPSSLSGHHANFRAVYFLIMIMSMSMFGSMSAQGDEDIPCAQFLQNLGAVKIRHQAINLFKEEIKKVENIYSIEHPFEHHPVYTALKATMEDVAQKVKGIEVFSTELSDEAKLLTIKVTRPNGLLDYHLFESNRRHEFFLLHTHWQQQFGQAPQISTTRTRSINWHDEPLIAKTFKQVLATTTDDYDDFIKDLRFRLNIGGSNLRGIQQALAKLNYHDSFDFQVSTQEDPATDKRFLTIVRPLTPLPREQVIEIWPQEYGGPHEDEDFTYIRKFRLNRYERPIDTYGLRTPDTLFYGEQVFNNVDDLEFALGLIIGEILAMPNDRDHYRTSPVFKLIQTFHNQDGRF